MTRNFALHIIRWSEWVKGLVWNGVSTDRHTGCFYATYDRHIGSIAFRNLAGCDEQQSDQIPTATYEIIGPQVFRFEYCYLRTDGTLSITPPSQYLRESQQCAIVVDIAVIDPKSKVLLTDAQITSLAAATCG